MHICKTQKFEIGNAKIKIGFIKNSEFQHFELKKFQNLELQSSEFLISGFLRS